MRNRWRLLLVVFLCFLLLGCGKTLDMSKLISSPVKEIVVYTSGKETRITDQETIDSVAEVIGKSVFKPAAASRLNIPGATSVRVDVIMENGMVTITYPCFQYDGRVYDAGSDSVQDFYTFIGQ
ncbi:MAG: hypothetical protein IJK47_01625 [Lachnospiraceae bacterium]|nr:hypothetical protein [Lachnospiraceae bacterium]